MAFWDSGLSFLGFKILKFFEFEFFRFKKIGSKFVEFTGLRDNFDQNLAKMHLFFGKIFYSSKMDLIEFQFSDFFRVPVLAIFRDRVFFGFGFGKVAKTRGVFEFR